MVQYEFRTYYKVIQVKANTWILELFFTEDVTFLGVKKKSACMFMLLLSVDETSNRIHRGYLPGIRSAESTGGLRYEGPYGKTLGYL